MIGPVMMGGKGGWSAFNWKSDSEEDEEEEKQDITDPAYDPDLSLAPAAAQFETLKDGSTALLIQQGTR